MRKNDREMQVMVYSGLAQLKLCLLSSHFNPKLKVPSYQGSFKPRNPLILTILGLTSSNEPL